MNMIKHTTHTWHLYFIAGSGSWRAVAVSVCFISLGQGSMAQKRERVYGYSDPLVPEDPYLYSDSEDPAVKTMKTTATDQPSTTEAVSEEIQWVPRIPCSFYPISKTETMEASVVRADCDAECALVRYFASLLRQMRLNGCIPAPEVVFRPDVPNALYRGARFSFVVPDGELIKHASRLLLLEGGAILAYRITRNFNEYLSGEVDCKIYDLEATYGDVITLVFYLVPLPIDHSYRGFHEIDTKPWLAKYQYQQTPKPLPKIQPMPSICQFQEGDAKAT